MPSKAFAQENLPTVLPLCYITWDADGGKINGYGKITQNLASGLPFGSILPVPTRSGYDFDSWYNWQSGFKTKISKDTIIPSTNTTYYAEWDEGAGNSDSNLGKPINLSKIDPNTKIYADIANLSNVDVIARTIFAEICDAGIHDISCASAVAQVIKNRMDNEKMDARSVVISPGQFSCTSDGNSNFGNPLQYGQQELWNACVSLATQLADNKQTVYDQSVGNRTFYYDLKYGNPFYVLTNNGYVKWDQKANADVYHLYKGVYTKQTQGIVIVGTTAFFETY